MIPISAREWKKKPSAPHISFVSDHDKEVVWTDIGEHFMFDTNDEELKRRIWEWKMKKMTTLFRLGRRTCTTSLSRRMRCQISTLRRMSS